jgi:hypothetical protein
MHATLQITPNRRSYLKAAACGAAGFALSSGLPASAVASLSQAATTGKSVIFLFMQGGPSQFETFDPKPDISTEMRTVGESVATKIPGVQFGKAMSRLAGLADRLAVVRSYQTGTQHGGVEPITSASLQGASLGAVYGRVAGTTHPTTGVPSSANLWPIAVDSTQPGVRDRFGRFDLTGPLGPGYAPMAPGGAGTFQQNLQLRLPADRLGDRQQLLGQLDTARRAFDRESGPLDALRSQAFDMLIKGVSQAFDLGREDPKTLARYDTGHFYEPKLWGPKKNAPWYTAHQKTLGKLLLLARRLCEAGCGFININTEFVWDMHADGNNLDVKTGMDVVGLPFDHGVSAFIEDVEARGLSEKILLVCCGEMGRTPKINKNGGRDHWPQLAPLILYGGGLTRGQVIGQSNKDGGVPISKPCKPVNLLATITRTLFDVGQVRLLPGMAKEVVQMLGKLEETPGVL